MSEFDTEQNAESIKIDESGEILKIDWKDGTKSRLVESKVFEKL